MDGHATSSADGGGTPVRARCPGRVNLIGDHTDYNGGVALPMAVDLETTVVFRPDASARVVLTSAQEPGVADVDVSSPLRPDTVRALDPPWARYVGAVVAAVRPARGGSGEVTSTLPLGAGLSSSAALEVATALALGFDADPLTFARTCQRAEHVATGVPTGLMDQWTVRAARHGHALLLDFSSEVAEHVPLPPGAEVVVVHSGERRAVARSAYAARRAECEAAALGLGLLGTVPSEVAAALPDPVLRRRARHVTTECERVRDCAAALRRGDVAAAGTLMTRSHHSLAEDFEVSTPALDALVAWLVARPGVYGARLTGAGFGGCVVTLAAPGALDPAGFGTPAWRVRAAAGASVSRG